MWRKRWSWMGREWMIDDGYGDGINGMGSGIGAWRALDLFMGTMVKRVVRKSDHANNNYTCGPTRANGTALLHLLLNPHPRFTLMDHFLHQSWNKPRWYFPITPHQYTWVPQSEPLLSFLPACLLKEWQCSSLTLNSRCSLWFYWSEQWLSHYAQ